MNDRFESLPLFPEETPPATRAPGAERAQGVSAGAAGATHEGRGKGDSHLIAAKRLARAMRRFPDHSPEQTRAGQAICRHLLALLDESEGR
jgi:hypothetical protein